MPLSKDRNRSIEKKDVDLQSYEQMKEFNKRGVHAV